MFERTEIILGKENIEKLKQSKIIIFGVGGVGGYACEMLARMGVGEITIVDFDVVSKSNINRQIIALNSTVNKLKVDVMSKRVKDINPDCNIVALNEKLLPENIEKFNLQYYDYVIDCIDMLKSKTSLIDYCYKNNIKIICAMGAGNKRGIPKFEVCDIFKTQYDNLAKKLRKELKVLGVKKLDVVCSNQQSIKAEKVGSLVYYPAVCGATLASFVVESLLEK